MTGITSTARRLPDATLPWPIVWQGVALIAAAEGCRTRAYRCPAGVWTCGWGETEGVTASTQWAEAYCDQRLADSLAVYADRVRALCTEPPTDNQLAAMVSLAYNIGVGGFASSSVRRAHNRRDYQAAARAFGLWNKATIGGHLTPLPGLTARRAAEAALYLAPEAQAAKADMPQAIAPESTLAASPIANAGAITTATGAAAAVLAQAQEHIGPLQQGIAWARHLLLDTLGVPPAAVLPVILVAAGVAVIYWRVKQRRDGWA